MIEISVKLILLPQSVVCKGPYKPGRSDDLTADEVGKLERKYKVSDVYKLPSGKTTPLPLPRAFHQALIADIGEGTYAVLLVFDWGSLTQLKLVVDLVRGPTQYLPEWSKKQPKYDVGQYWYAHQNAVDFDPDESVTWQVTLNGPRGSSFLFYAVPAR